MMQQLVKMVLLVAGLGGAAALGVLSASEPGSSSQVAEKPVTPIKEVHRGQHVLLAGTVARLSDSDEFVLEDESGRIKIYIGWKNRMPVAKGDSVKVWGVADDDTFPGFRPEIYAYRIQLASGKTIDLSRGHD
jgi:uncharacterized protein YdeI (BOF family)